MKFKHSLMEQAEGAAAAGGSGAAAGTPQVAPAANTPWYQGADAEIIGHMQTKGWDKKAANEVALEAIKSFREAEKFIGAPANELLRVPKEVSDEAGWNKVWSRLGKPADPKEYDFSTIKFADGTPLAEDFTNFMRQQAFKLNMPKEAATAITNEFAKYMESAEMSEKTESAAKIAEERSALARNWGANLEANKFIAQRAAAALGVDPATVAALENVVGYAKVMDMFLNIGQKIGEDKFITGNRGEQNGVLTREQAQSRKGELMNDKEWVKSYLAGDTAKKREMTALNTLLSS